MTGVRFVLLMTGALCLAGCGSTIESAGDPDPPPAVAAASVEPRTAHAETVLHSEYAGQATTMRELAAFDFRRGRSRTETFVGDSDTPESAVIKIGRVSYYELAPGSWVRYAERPESVGTVPGTGFPVDPTQIVPYLRRQDSDVHVIGREDVRGVETTRYTFRFDGDLGTSPSSNALGDETRGDFVVDVWVDRGDLVRRYRWAFAGVVTGDGGGAYRYESTTDYFDFGVAVEIEPPPARHVQGEWDELAGEVDR